MKRAISAGNNRSPSRQRNQGGVKTSNLNKKPLILNRAGGPPDFSWSLRGADTHTVSQIYLSLFAVLSQMHEPLPNSIRVIPDTIIFCASGPTTWFAFDHKQRRVLPHAAIHSTAANILRYFTEVMRSREIVDMSVRSQQQQHQQQQDYASSVSLSAAAFNTISNSNNNTVNINTSGSPRFPCAVWIFDAVDVKAQDQMSEQDRHVCVEYLDLAGVQSLVDRLVSGRAPPNGVLQEFVACDTPSLTGSSEEFIATVQIPAPSQQDDNINSNNINVGNRASARPGITSLSTGLLELTSVHRFRNLHMPRNSNLMLSDQQQRQLPSSSSSSLVNPMTNIINDQQSSTPISTQGFCAIPPLTLVYQTTEGSSVTTDNLTCVVRESEDVVQQLRASPPGWSVTATTTSSSTLEPMLPNTAQTQDTLKFAHQLITALTRDRDHLGELNTLVGDGVAMLPYTKCSLWMKPLGQDLGGGFAFLGVSSMRIPTIRLDYTFIDVDSIFAMTQQQQQQGGGNSGQFLESTGTLMTRKGKSGGGGGRSPVRKEPPARFRKQSPPLPSGRSLSPVESPRLQQNQQQQQQQQQQSHPVRTFTPRPTSATSFPQQAQRRTPAAPPPVVAPPPPRHGSSSSSLTGGVRHQDLAGLSRNPATIEQNVDRLFEQHQVQSQQQQPPPRPQSALQYAHQQQQQHRHTPVPPPTRPTSAMHNNINISNTPSNNISAMQQQIEFMKQQQQQQQQMQQHQLQQRAPPQRPRPSSALSGFSNLRNVGEIRNENNASTLQQRHFSGGYDNNYKNDDCQVEHVYFSKVTEKELAGLRAAETVETKPYTEAEKPEEISCPNCGAWQLRNDCYSLSYHTIASAVNNAQKRNERALKKVFPRRGKFTAQRQASSLDAVRTANSEDVLFDDKFEWAPVPPVLKQIKVVVDDILAREVWRQRTVLLCSACASDLYDKDDAELTDRLNRFLAARKNAYRSASAVLRRGTSRGQLDLSMRAASPEQAGVDYLVGNNSNAAASSAFQDGRATFSSFAIPPFNAAHSQIAARNSIHERPPPASVFSNVTDALVMTDLQAHHREIRQARRDKYAMRLVATDCHRGVDVFSATLAKHREIENLLHSLVLPIPDLGISGQIDDPLSLTLSRDLYHSIARVCKEPAELALGVVMSRPAKGKGPWRIPKPVATFIVNSNSNNNNVKNVKKLSSTAATTAGAAQTKEDLRHLVAEGEDDEDEEGEFCPLPIGEERQSAKRKRMVSSRTGADTRRRRRKISQLQLQQQQYSFALLDGGDPTSSSSSTFSGGDHLVDLMMNARMHTYSALSAGSQTFAEMNQNERDAIIQFLGSEESILNDNDHDDE